MLCCFVGGGLWCLESPLMFPEFPQNSSTARIKHLNKILFASSTQQPTILPHGPTVGDVCKLREFTLDGVCSTAVEMDLQSPQDNKTQGGRSESGSRAHVRACGWSFARVPEVTT